MVSNIVKKLCSWGHVHNGMKISNLCNGVYVVNKVCILGHTHNRMRILMLCNGVYVVNEVCGLGHVHIVLMTVRRVQCWPI